MTTLHLNEFSPQRARRIVDEVMNSIGGHNDDRYGIGKRFWSAVAYSLFSSIFTAFVRKSQHEADDLGNTWKDLSPKYKAYNRPDARQGLTLYDNRAVRTPGLRVRPTLPPSINRQWAGRWFGLFIHLSEDKEHAGAATWDYFKAKGYPTLAGLTKHKKLPILNKSGVLQKSVFPWPLQGGIYVPYDKNQIFRTGNGRLELGTKFPYVNILDKDRPIWPEDIGPWVNRAMGEGRDAVFKYLPEVIEEI